MSKSGRDIPDEEMRRLKAEAQAKYGRPPAQSQAELDAIRARKRASARKRYVTKSVRTAMAPAMRHERPPPAARQASKARVAAVQWLEAYLGKSMEVVRDSIEANDIDTAKWLIDRVAKSQGTVVRLPDGGFPTHDPVETAEYVARAVLTGDMEVEGAIKVLDMLDRQQALQGNAKLDALRATLERLSGDAARTIDGEVLSPTWLRLADQTSER